jgi:hypothetical protein
LATVDKNFKIKNGLTVGDSTNLVNYTSSSPSNPFLGQLWINETYLYAWSSASTWVLIGDGTASGGGGGIGGTASGTSLNISNTLVARSASGTFAIGAIDFDTTASPVLSVGRMQWNQNFGTPEVGLIGGNVTANIGQHVHAYVTNDEGSSLVAGDVVYLFGAAGDRASVKKAYNLSDATSSKTFGVVAETIAAGQAGFVTVFGVVNKLDLSSYNPGDVLWLSASPGKFTSIKPSAPQHLVFVGVVEKTNAGNGQLFVNIQNGYELEELHSVQITNLTDNDILSYNGSSSLWFNQNLSAAIQEVDGPGSGIDSDLLDGQEGLYYQDSAGASATYLKQSDAASAYIRVTSSAAIVENYIPVSSSYAYLTRSDAELTYIPITASSEYLTESEAAGLYIPISASFGTFDADKLDGFDSSYFINSSSATQEKLGMITFHDTVNIKNLVITGSAVTISSTNLALTDSLIQLAHEQYTTDAVDIGIIGSYGDGTTSSAGHYHASFARDASQNKWKLLSNGPAAINNVIDYSDPSVQFGNLQLGSIEILGSASAINNVSAPTFTGLLLGNAMSASSIDWSLITNKSITLGTDTAGDYVSGAVGGNGIVISGTSGEGWSPTITLHSAALTASVSGTSPTAAESNGFRNITMSTSSATGGSDGDIWLVYV